MDPNRTAPDGDYDFFAPARPATPAAAPPNAHADPSRFGTFVGPTAGVGAHGNPNFGPPVGQPIAGTTWPTAPSRPAMPIWAKVCIGLAGAAGGLVVLGIIAAIAIPVFLNRSATATLESTSIAMPATIGAYTRLDTPEANQITEPTRQQMLRQEHVDAVEIGVYDSQAGRGMFMATKFDKPMPKHELGEATRVAFAGLASSGVKVAGITPVEPGRLGGVMECGTGAIATAPVKVCVSADQAAVAVVVFYNAAIPDSTALEVREAIEIRR